MTLHAVSKCKHDKEGGNRVFALLDDLLFYRCGKGADLASTSNTLVVGSESLQEISAPYSMNRDV